MSDYIHSKCSRVCPAIVYSERKAKTGHHLNFLLPFSAFVPYDPPSDVRTVQSLFVESCQLAPSPPRPQRHSSTQSQCMRLNRQLPLHGDDEPRYIINEHPVSWTCEPSGVDRRHKKIDSPDSRSNVSMTANGNFSPVPVH